MSHATLRPIVHLLRAQNFLMPCYFEIYEVTVRSRAPAALLNVLCLLLHIPLQALPRVCNKAAQAPKGTVFIWLLQPLQQVKKKNMMKNLPYILFSQSDNSASTRRETTRICRTKATCIPHPVVASHLLLFSIHLKLAHRNPIPTPS